MIVYGSVDFGSGGKVTLNRPIATRTLPVVDEAGSVARSALPVLPFFFFGGGGGGVYLIIV